MNREYEGVKEGDDSELDYLCISRVESLPLMHTHFYLIPRIHVYIHMCKVIGKGTSLKLYDEKLS